MFFHYDHLKLHSTKSYKTEDVYDTKLYLYRNIPTNQSTPLKNRF
ncbi:unnamed protein product [Arabidopsis halleri]